MMTNKTTLVLCALLLLWGCGSSTSNNTATSENASEPKEHFLSDHQRALESAKSVAGAIEEAAERNAAQVEKLKDDD
jgi:outer membrane biogenesis lipoprotein LolB